MLPIKEETVILVSSLNSKVTVYQKILHSKASLKIILSNTFNLLIYYICMVIIFITRIARFCRSQWLLLAIL